MAHIKNTAEKYLQSVNKLKAIPQKSVKKINLKSSWKGILSLLLVSGNYINRSMESLQSFP